MWFAVQLQLQGEEPGVLVVLEDAIPMEAHLPSNQSSNELCSSALCNLPLLNFDAGSWEGGVLRGTDANGVG